MASTSGSEERATPLSDRWHQPHAGVIGLTAGATSVQSAELRELLWRRLRGLFAILSLLGPWLLARIFLIKGVGSNLSIFEKGFAGCSVVLSLVGVVFLWRKRALSIRSLRQIELSVLLVLLSILGLLSYRYMVTGFIMPATLEPALAAKVQAHFWAIYPDNSILFTAGFQALAGFLLLRWCFIAVLYGVLIPNTWRRCALSMGLIISAYFMAVSAAAMHSPAFAKQAGPLLSLSFPLLGAFAAVGVYGCHKLNALSAQVYAAKEVGQYRLERRLGSGGMGEVYLARHRMLRRPCALKLIRPDQAGSMSVVARFEREVQAMAKLTHANTVEIYDYGRTDDGLFYYVMEFLPGASLDALVKRHGPLSPGRAVHLLQQVCGALREAHATGLIHRDIKPGNIFVCERGGEYDRVKLLDFGLVQVAGMSEPDSSMEVEDPARSAAASGDKKLTLHGHILGTPNYMSPEQVRSEATDPSSDIYSLGAVAYFLLTGHPPFRRALTADTYRAHLSEQPRLPSERRADVPKDLEAVVMRCLSKERGDRYASAKDLEAALSSCACARDWNAAKAEEWWQSREQIIEPQVDLSSDSSNTETGS